MNHDTKPLEKVIIKLEKSRIIPVLVIKNIKEGLHLCNILNNQGLNSVEITFRTTVAENMIKEISRQFPNMLIGAGTILNVTDLHRAFNAGAKFAVSPGFNPTVVKEAIKSGYSFMPGITSPTQIEQAMELGIKNFKFFPAEAVGGVPMLQSIIAPYRHLGISFIPTGGIKLTNLENYLIIPEVTAVGGTWLRKKKSETWTDVRKKITETVNIISGL